ncbi:MAG: 6-phospho-beta-glucosidase [Anaerolineaceae bacterium]|jgi:6-phospho-beta-glucosidase
MDHTANKKHIIGKLTVIGGGSTYTPELLDGFITHQDRVHVDRISLYDIEPKRLEIVGGLARRMFQRAGLATHIDLHRELAPALDGASFVLSQIRVGFMAARILDEKIPLRHGVLGQETVGPGGLANALRTIPVSLHIAAEVEKRSPDAWFLNFTNPSSIITQALIQHSGLRKVVGLCNVPITSQRCLADLLSVGEEELWLDWIGLNHLGWIRDIHVNGHSRICEVLELLKQCPTKEARARFPFEASLFETLQMVPTYYLHYYYETSQAIEDVHTAGKTRGEIVAEIERDLLGRYNDPRMDVKPPELNLRGGALYSEAAFRLIYSLLSDRRDIQVLIVRNDGAIPELPAEAIVEIPCVVGAAGPSPLVRRKMPPSSRPLIEAVYISESLCVDAAVKGSKRMARLAMWANPLVPSYAVAERITDQLLEAHQVHLSNFFKKGPL